MPKVFTSETQKIGETGENTAVKFLVKRGFSILERNYTKKWGEIDIIAQKDSKLYFIEVKSVARDSLQDVPSFEKTQDVPPFVPQDVPPFVPQDVPHGTLDQYRPEDNMHPWKLKRLSRTIQTYLISKKIDENIEWQFDLLVVFLDLKNKKARVRVISDIIL